MYDRHLHFSGADRPVHDRYLHFSGADRPVHDRHLHFSGADRPVHALLQQTRLHFIKLHPQNVKHVDATIAQVDAQWLLVSHGTEQCHSNALRFHVARAHGFKSVCARVRQEAAGDARVVVDHQHCSERYKRAVARSV